MKLQILVLHGAGVVWALPTGQWSLIRNTCSQRVSCNVVGVCYAGAVAAIGAALTRPALVGHLAELISMLQTLWLLFPQVRRGDETKAANAQV